MTPSTLSDLDHSFDGLYPSSFSNVNIRDVLVIIGFIAICSLLLVLIIQFILRVRRIYRTSETKERSKKAYQTKVPSYQKLVDIDKNQCKCLQYSCLPKFQCVKPTCQILNRSSYYEKIDERQLSNCTHRPCIRVHIIK